MQCRRLLCHGNNAKYSSICKWLIGQIQNESEKERGRERKRLEDENGTKLQLKLLRELQKFAVEDCACGCEWEWKVKMTQDVDVQFLIKLATAPLHNKHTAQHSRYICDIQSKVENCISHFRTVFLIEKGCQREISCKWEKSRQDLKVKLPIYKWKILYIKNTTWYYPQQVCRNSSTVCCIYA